LCENPVPKPSFFLPSCGGVVFSKIGSVQPHAMQHDGHLAGEREVLLRAELVKNTQVMIKRTMVLNSIIKQSNTGTRLARQAAVVKCRNAPSEETSA
jgi:hypothetical protein